MASAAGGSGTGGGDRCPSGEKCKTPLGRRCKKPSAFHRAALCYLEKEYRECVARGDEPLFDLEDLLRRYGSSPPNSGFSSAIFFCASKKSVRAFSVPTQGRLKTYVLMC